MLPENKYTQPEAQHTQHRQHQWFGGMIRSKVNVMLEASKGAFTSGQCHHGHQLLRNSLLCQHAISEWTVERAAIPTIRTLQAQLQIMSGTCHAVQPLLIWERN